MSPSTIERTNFRPVWWASGSHAQTILGNLLPCPGVHPGAAAKELCLDDGDRLVLLTEEPDTSPRGGVLLMHGLGGSADATYMRLASHGLIANGFRVFRLNHRGAGTGAGLAKRTYQLGGSDDVRQVIEYLTSQHPGLPLFAVGFSMSGDMLLKYLGEESDRAASLLKGAISVNPPIDISLAMAALEQRQNWIYHRRFTRLMTGLAHRNFANMKEQERLSKIKPTGIRSFDTQVTAPLWGYDSAETYYREASPLPVLKKITLNTLVITSEDDPFVPVSTFLESTWSSAVTVRITARGGHMGYLSKGNHPFGYDRWLYDTLLKTMKNLIAL